MKKTNTGFLLWGDSGNGKTHTAACIANALMEKEVSVLMRNMSYFLNAGFEDREEFIRDVQRYGLLIIDDLGMERGTEYGLEWSSVSSMPDMKVEGLQLSPPIFH